ncbi:MAG: Gfo/Idh/MocA family oxidoreductase [Planctomycetes bacterium]|nr:Gfo/Idh/MocA family oxidoreductase [Planctomycetota bacterium]
MEMTRREFGKIAGAGIAFLRAGVRGADAPSRALRACVIGHTGRGNYGHGLDTCFQKIPGITVAAVADPDEAGRAAAAKRAGAARTYADWRAMLEKEKPDLVSIGMRWVENRLALVSAAAAAGAHVYMEKPIAASLAEADAIVAAAEKAKIQVSVAHQVRLAPSLLHLATLVEKGLIGDLLEVRTRGKEDHRSGGEDMAVLGTHCMYLMRFFAGEASWCAARILQDGREIAAEDRREATEPLGPVAGDTVHATYAFAKGVQGTFASQKVPPRENLRFQMVLHGSRGLAVVHIDQDPKIFFLADPLWSPGRTGAAWAPLPGCPSNADPSGLTGMEAANKRIVEEMLRCAETGERATCGIREARSALEMIMAAYAAHLRGARVGFPLAERRHPLLAGA